MPRKNSSQILEKSTVTELIPSLVEGEELTIADAELSQVDSQSASTDEVKLKFEVEVESFNSKLSTALLAVPTKPTHPSLGNVLLAAIDRQVKLTGFDYNLGITVSCEANVEHQGMVILPAKLLQSITSRLPVGKLTVTANAKSVVSLSCASGKYQIRGANPDDFPTLPALDANNHSFQVKPLLLATALRYVLFAAATEETRQVLTGVHLQFDADSIELAASDSHRLAFATIANPYVEDETIPEFSVTIPASKLQQLERILSESTAHTISLAFDESKAWLTIGTTELVMRLLAGEYAQYRQLIPQEQQTTVRFERKQLISLLERLAVLTDKNYVVVADINQSEQSIQLTAETANWGSGVEVIEALVTGQSLRIGLNIKYLLEGLKKLDTAWVELLLDEPTTPIIISPVESLIPTTQVLMPIEIKH